MDRFSASIDDPKLLRALSKVPASERTPWTRQLTEAAAASKEGVQLFK